MITSKSSLNRIKRLPFYRKKCCSCGHIYKVRICPLCKKEFKLARITQEYCSKLCSKQASNRRIRAQLKELNLEKYWGVKRKTKNKDNIKELIWPGF
jgi:hypothetical protein